MNHGYAVTSYASQGKTVDTVLLADASNRAATTANQWYVSISRARKRALVFTSDKAALKSHIQRMGGRELALQLKTAASDPKPINEVRARSVWMRRAREIMRTIRRIKFINTRRAAAQRTAHAIKL